MRETEEEKEEEEEESTAQIREIRREKIERRK